MIPKKSTALHADLVGRISRLIADQGLAAGTRLSENGIAVTLGVSRTPVRAAFDALARQGYVRRERHRGVALVKPPPLPRPPRADAAAGGDAAGDALLLRIALDRRHGRLGETVSEQQLMQAYGLGRPALRQALQRLAELGVVERRLGYGWRFVDTLHDLQARQESYRFRMTVEPAALREPAFALAPGWVAAMRERHEATLRLRWSKPAAVAFFEMNAAFHEGLAAASGNRFFLDAIRRQNRLRRLGNYDWTFGRPRVVDNCREHLEILDRLEAGDREVAALLMHRHLDVARALRPPADAAT